MPEITFSAADAVAHAQKLADLLMPIYAARDKEIKDRFDVEVEKINSDIAAKLEDLKKEQADRIGTVDAAHDNETEAEAQQRRDMAARHDGLVRFLQSGGPVTVTIPDPPAVA
ncbi:MAG: hypothetical protein P4L82_12225 [Ancalomicrobiaceae bacterium]|nr:hypothetical protein [Ancalomicrobiaceae bacterium]